MIWCFGWRTDSVVRWWGVESEPRESLARKRGGARRFNGNKGCDWSHPTVSIGGELWKPSAAAKVWKDFFSLFFPPFFPFLMCPCVRREEGIVMGIWCQTSKPFYSLREPPGQNVELSSQLRSCPSLSQWLGLSACFLFSHFLFHTKWDWNSKMLSALFELVNKSQCLKNTTVRLCFESYGCLHGRLHVLLRLN